MIGTLPGAVVETNNQQEMAAAVGTFSTEQAAEYLGLSVPSVKHHVHNVGDLRPAGKIGAALIFTKAELDRFKAAPRPTRGRPKRKEG
jgi:hypothetical protein